MANQPTKTSNAPELPRFEEVLLCAPEGDEKIHVTPTIKWMETVMVTKPGEDGEEKTEVLGFLVTVPPKKALRVYSHICRNEKSHTQAIGILEKDKSQKDRTLGSLPAVWNGHYTGCPLCTLNHSRKESTDGCQ